MATFTLKHFFRCKNIKIFNFVGSQKILSNQRFYSSALFIPGSKANKVFAFLSPDLNFDERFSNMDQLKKELNLRSININVQELHKTWSYYKYILSNRHTLEKKLSEFTEEIEKIKKKKDPSPDDTETTNALVVKVQLLRKDLRTIKEALWDVEESVIPTVLKLPNELDNDTPQENSIVLKSVGEKVTENTKLSHIDIGKKLGLLNYLSPVHCFLTNDAVSFELGTLFMAGKILREAGALQLSGPDFSKSFVVEGCGLDHKSSAETFILKNTDDVNEDDLINTLHLVGGASLPALLAMFIKKTFNHKSFPIRIFNTGRQYNPFPNTSVDFGLFSLNQGSVLQAVTLVKSKDCDDYKSDFKNLIHIASNIYDQIGCHYRIVMRSAKELHASESMKASFEMWSAHTGQYIEVGHVSAYGNYLSKRLLIGSTELKNTQYSAIIAGTLISIPRVLGCLLEENPNKFILPQKISEII